MPRARLQPGNPEWIAILEQRREAILDKDPTANWAHSLSRAIGELKRTEDTLDYPGQRQIKFIGPKIIELLTKELAKGPIRSDETYPSSESGPLDFPGVHGFDPQTFSFHHKKAKIQSKGRAPAPLKASASLPNLTIAGPPTPPAIDQARCVEVYRPKEGSGEAALLIGLYSQCNATRQRIAVEKELLLLCGEAYATGTSPNCHDLAALVNADCLEEGSLTLTWKGFRSAERCAIKRGLPRIHITVDDFAQPGTSVSLRQTQTAVTIPPAARPIQQPQAVVRTQVLPERDSCIPRKRKTSAMCDAYSDLGMSGVNGQGQALPAAPFLPKAAPKKIATGAFARTYVEAPVKTAAPVADALPFCFAYLDNRDNRVPRRDQADVKIQDITGNTLFRVEFRSKQARHPIARTIKDAVPLTRTPAEAEGATEAGWLIADKAPPTCSGLISSAAAKKPKQTARADLMAGLKEKPKEDPRAMYRFPPASTLGMGSSSSSPEKACLRQPIAESTTLRRTVSDSAAGPAAPFAYKQPAASISGSTRPLPNVQRVAKPYIAPSAYQTVAPAPPSIESRPVYKAPHALPGGKRTITSSFPLGTAAETPAFNPIVLQPNDYDVVLLVDHREVKGVTNIEATLFAQGTPFEVVNLELGDYLWVARRRERLEDNYDEVVLAICERKRKDDFMTSIKNERYRDQKQRIRLTGIRKCFYLTEHHDLEYETFIKAIQTSMSQTQVIDDFTLLVALSPAETIAHLRRITTALQQAIKPLLIIPDDLVKPNTISLLQRELGQKQPQADYYTTWSSFERINRKQFTLHSVWAKMASCMNGVSQEVCVDLLEHYPSPIAFLAGIEGRLAGEEQAGRLADRSQVGPKRKKLKGDDVGLHVKNVLDRGYRPRPLNGPASEGIWKLFTSCQYE